MESPLDSAVIDLFNYMLDHVDLAGVQEATEIDMVSFVPGQDVLAAWVVIWLENTVRSV